MTEEVLVLEKKESFFDKHGDFIKGCYYVAYGLSFVYSFFSLIYTSYQAALDGQIAVVVFNALFMFIVISLQSLLGAAVWGTIFVVIFFLPYLVIRGLRK